MHGERGLDDKPEVEKAEPEELLDTDTTYQTKAGHQWPISTKFVI